MVVSLTFLSGLLSEVPTVKIYYVVSFMPVIAELRAYTLSGNDFHSPLSLRQQCNGSKQKQWWRRPPMLSVERMKRNEKKEGEKIRIEFRKEFV